MLLFAAEFPRQPQETGLHGTLVYLLLLLRPRAGLQHLPGRGQREGSPEARQQTGPADGLEQEERTLQQPLSRTPHQQSPAPHPANSLSPLPQINTQISTSISSLGKSHLSRELCSSLTSDKVTVFLSCPSFRHMVLVWQDDTENTHEKIWWLYAESLCDWGFSKFCLVIPVHM